MVTVGLHISQTLWYVYIPLSFDNYGTLDLPTRTTTEIAEIPSYFRAHSSHNQTEIH